MNRYNIIKKVIAKISKDETVRKKINKKEVMDLIYDNFVNRQEASDEDYKRKEKLDDREHDILRKIYDYGEVKKLYTYGLSKFGFIVDNLRFDVDPGFVEIKRLK